MKKIILFLLLILCVNLDASNWYEDWELQARVAAYCPSSHLMRKIYTHCGAEYQLELSKCCWGPIYTWSNIGWFSKRGHSLGVKNETRINIMPLSWGLKYMCWLDDNASAYIGLGAVYTILRIKDDTEFVRRHTNREAWGGVIKSGIRYAFTPCVFADFFVDYMYQNFHFKETDSSRSDNINVGGFKVGIGLGTRF